MPFERLRRAREPSRRPIVHLYTICWNEADLLPFFFRHYDEVVDRYVVFDDGSDDGSLDLLRTHDRVEVRPLGERPDGSYVLRAKEIHDEAWKESRGEADWVILSAVDELFVHADLGGYLARMQRDGVTAVPALGYQMVSPTFPPPGDSLLDHVRDGAPWAQMSKLVAFRPDRIDTTGFANGRHRADPTGDVRYPARDECLNLHCKYIDFEVTFARHRALLDKLGDHDRSQNWGHRYGWDRAELRRDWEGFTADAVPDVVASRSHAHETHAEPRWWRDDRPSPTRGTGPQWTFVCGCARSGTSTTTELLRAHPTVVLGRERYTDLFKSDHRAFEPGLFEQTRFLSDLQPGDTHHRNLGDYYADLASRWDDRTHVGDKIPTLHRHYDEVAGRFPGARFVFLFRNVVDVAQSWADRRQHSIETGGAWDVDNGPRQAVAAWNQSLHDTIDALTRGVPIFALAHEDLYVDDDLLGDLADFLELDPVPELAQRWRRFGRRRQRLEEKRTVRLSSEDKRNLCDHADLDAYRRLRTMTGR